MIQLPVCTCGENKVASEHTLDVHDEKTGECRSIVEGLSCPCTHFVDSGRRVTIDPTS